MKKSLTTMTAEMIAGEVFRKRGPCSNTICEQLEEFALKIRIQEQQRICESIFAHHGDFSKNVAAQIVTEGKK
jgi:hypothetical protein